MSDLTSKNRALEILGAAWRPPMVPELVPVPCALGRVPLKDLRSLNDIPVVRSAAMDGWAVKSSAFAGGMPDTRGWVEGRDYARADMGDDFDDAFDAVVLVEDAAIRDGALVIAPEAAPAPGSNVRQAGSQIARGDLLARAGRPLLPKDLAMLQMGGLAAIEVAKKPLVAFIPTGAELISPGPPPARGQNIDTNSLLVARTLEGWGAEAWLWPVVADDPGAIAAALDLSLSRADVVILNGGSSKGGEDHNAKLLSSRARTLFKGVAAAPGKPMAAFLAGDRLVVNLPGPMIAAYYGLEWCLKWIVARALGVSPAPRPKVLAVLSEPLEAPEALSFLFNIKLTKAPDGSWSARPLDPRKAKTSEGIDANAQYMSVLGQGRLPAGQAIWVEALRPEEVLEG